MKTLAINLHNQLICSNMPCFDFERVDVVLIMVMRIRSIYYIMRTGATHGSCKSLFFVASTATGLVVLMPQRLAEVDSKTQRRIS
jgi:hypothetical protein